MWKSRSCVAMDDYHRWMTRKGSGKRAIVFKQTLVEDGIMVDRWPKQKLKRYENIDLYQDEIYQTQHGNNTLSTLYGNEKQIKQMKKHFERNIDILKRENYELWTKLADLVKDYKWLENELCGYDLNFDNQLKKENSSTFDMKLEAAALREESINKGRGGPATSVDKHGRSGICSPKSKQKKESPMPVRFRKETQALQDIIQHNEEFSLKYNTKDEVAGSKLKQQLISCEQEKRLAYNKIQEQKDKIKLLKEENEKMMQSKINQRSYQKEITELAMHSKQETERLERERQLDQQAFNSSQQTQHVMIRKLKLHIKQTEDKLCLATEELYGERSRNAKLSQDRTKYAEKFEKMCALTNELESERNKISSKKTIQYEENVDKLSVMKKELENEISKNAKERTKSAETLHLMTKELESERSRNVMLLKESNHYKEQLRELKQAHVELTNNHAIFRSEKRQSGDLTTATENNQQLELNLSDLNRSTEDVIGEMCSLNDKATKLTDVIERKDRDISKLQSELQKKNQEIEDIQGELALIKESNEKNERLISDLHIKISLYKRKFNETSPDSGDLTNTISHLEREVEGYKNELKMAREEMKHATEKIQQAERDVSDLKLSEHAWNEEVDSLNDQIKELTKKKDNDISRLENKLQRKCQKIENTMTEVAMIKGQNKSNEQLINHLQIELDQYKTNFKDEHSNSAEMNNTIITLRGKLESYESELKQAREEIRNATVNSRQMDQKISATKISEHSLVDERDSLKDKVIESTTILKRRDSEIREMKTKMAEFSSIKEKYIKFENDKSCHSAEMSRTISYLECEVEKNQSELKQAREETKRCALQLKSVNDEHGNCQNRIMSLHKENEKLRSMATYKGDQTKRSESVLSQREQELSIALEKTKRELREVQHDLEDTKTRLSKVMGQKLTDNNPNIADLSDKNRPTKLAERYSELYDNQWTDAFEVVNKQLHDEKSTIDSLIDILMTTAKFCRGEAMKQLEEIQGILLPKKVGTALPLLVHKNLKDCRKALGDLTGTAVYEKYMEENARCDPRSPHQDVKPFVKECIELCWLMSIQDPPVIIEPVVQRGAKFDTDFYKAYTSSGPLVDYVVWPALCLHEKGPLLCKGIAQGYGGKKTKF